VDLAGSWAEHHEMSPSSNRVGSSALEEIACGERQDNVVRSAVPSDESWTDAGVEVAVAVVVAAVPARSQST